MADDQHYDVIVIGTGAGGGTLGHRLAPTRQAKVLLARTRRLSCRGSATTGRSTAVFVRGQVPRAGGLVRRARPRVPARGQLLRRRQHQVLRRGAVPAATARTSASCATTAASPRPGRSRYDDLEPYYTQAEHLYLVHGEHGEDPTRGPAERAVRATRRCPHEPRIQQLSDDLEKHGLHPFHLPIGVNLDAGRSTGRATRDSVCIRCDRVDGFPCLVDAQVRRAGDLRRSGPVPRQRHPGDRRPRAAPGDRRRPGARSPGSSRRWTTDRSTTLHRRHRGGRLRRGELRGAAAALGERPAPGRAGQQLRTWSAGTTCGTTTWP